jgi:hypothetical protein
MAALFWACVTPERHRKTLRVMEGLARGIPGARVVHGSPPAGSPFAVWNGSRCALCPAQCARAGPFWHIDNGFHLSARGSAYGYYRITYRGMSPVLLRNPVPRPALHVAMRPWRNSMSCSRCRARPSAAPSGSTCPAGSRRSRRAFAPRPIG